MIDPKRVRFFLPNRSPIHWLPPRAYDRLGRAAGASIATEGALRHLDPEDVPAVGCSRGIRPLIDEWEAAGREWLYWDRGYFQERQYFRVHSRAFQMTRPRAFVDPDRWHSLDIDLKPWRKGGDKIVVAMPSRTYEEFFGCEGWTSRVVDELRKHTDRPIEVRPKDTTLRLADQIVGAHALVTHGSLAAVTSVLHGCPVFVDASSAAAPMGRTLLRDIERPVYPDRQEWIAALACCQFNEAEFAADGCAWRLIE